MEQLVKIFVYAGQGSVLIFLLVIGAVFAAKFHEAHPRASRWIAWTMMTGGLICTTFSPYVGLYFAILGAIFLAICDSNL